MIIKQRMKRVTVLALAFVMVLTVSAAAMPGAAAACNFTSAVQSGKVPAEGGSAKINWSVANATGTSVTVSHSLSGYSVSSTVGINQDGTASGTLSIEVSTPNQDPTEKTFSVALSVSDSGSGVGTSTTVIITQAGAAVQPSRPSIGSNQSAMTGNIISVSTALNSGESYYISTSNALGGKSSTSGAIYVSTFSSSSITVPSAAAGTYYLYVYNGIFSEPSLNYFTVVSDTSITRPVVTSGQTVKQGGNLKISHYNLPSGFEFAVKRSTGSYDYVACTTAAGSNITSVAMPTTLAEGTYYLYVRVKNSTTQVSDPSVNTFVVDNTTPQVYTTTPTANSAGVSPLTTFSITFDEPMSTNVGTTIIRNAGTGADPTITKTTWSNSDKTVTYTLSGLLSETAYTATIYNAAGTDITAFADAAGNPLRNEIKVTFTTGSSSSYSNNKSTIPLYATTTTSNNVLSAVIDETALETAITNAISDEGKGYSATLLLTLADIPSTAVGVNVTTSAYAINQITRNTSAVLAINAGHLGLMTFDKSALNAITGIGSGNVVFSTERLYSSTMPAAVYGVVGSNPTYEFGVTMGSRSVTSFGNGEATVSIPYSLASGYSVNQVAGFKVSVQGNLTPAFGSYNAQSGSFVFRLKGFSTYMIKYNPKTYTDVSSTDWYNTAVEYTAARGLLDVFTTGSTLDPLRKITRAEFVVMFMQAYGIEPGSATTAAQFSDVSEYSAYAPYLRTAKSLGLIRGTNAEGTTFNPEGSVTRDQFFTLTYNMLTAMNRMPTTVSGKYLNSFIDAAEVGSYATTATDALVRTGVVAGSNGYLNPGDLLSRSEIAQAVYNLIG